MKIYLLVCSGSVVVPQLKAEVHGMNTKDAVTRAQDWSKYIASHNVYRFTLWDTDGKEEKLVSTWSIDFRPTITCERTVLEGIES